MEAIQRSRVLGNSKPKRQPKEQDLEKARREELVLLPAEQTPAGVEGKAVIFHPDSVVWLFRADQTREKDVRLCVMGGRLWVGGWLACSRGVRGVGASRVRKLWLLVAMRSLERRGV